ncbi:MAG: ABC transporter permease [Acidimicrobiales bacterium]
MSAPALPGPLAAPRGGATAEATSEPLPRTAGAARQALATFAANRLAVAGVVALAAMALFSFAGPLLYHTNQVSANLLLENQPPSMNHLLGTSPAGRDELGRLMLGGRSTLEVGIAVGALATGFGLAWGLVAGFAGGVVDAVMMRVVDALLSVPYLFFVVVLASLIRPNLPLIILVIALISWLSTARLTRAETLGLRNRDYVLAAVGYGAGPRRVMTRYITPNLLGVVVVNGTLKVADAVLAFASISFLGLGVPPPATNWGTLVTAGVNNLFDGYWWQLWPAAALIVLTVLSVNVIGDGLRDVVERRLQRR